MVQDMANIDNFVPNALLELCSRTLDVLTQVTRMLSMRTYADVCRLCMRTYADVCRLCSRTLDVLTQVHACSHRSHACSVCGRVLTYAGARMLTQATRMLSMLACADVCGLRWWPDGAVHAADTTRMLTHADVCCGAC
jgi:hypothetical protein